MFEPVFTMSVRYRCNVMTHQCHSISTELPNLTNIDYQFRKIIMHLICWTITLSFVIMNFWKLLFFVIVILSKIRIDFPYMQCGHHHASTSSLIWIIRYHTYLYLIQEKIDFFLEYFRIEENLDLVPYFPSFRNQINFCFWGLRFWKNWGVSSHIRI